VADDLASSEAVPPGVGNTRAWRRSCPLRPVADQGTARVIGQGKRPGNVTGATRNREAVPLVKDILHELARYWATDYDWRRCEAKLNALPQFKTEIDGVDIHFIHVKSPHSDALPLIMTHGWPGSVMELLGTVGPLTDPVVHGGAASDAFDLVLPSLPGFGFSAEPAETGWDPGRIARAWAELMRRLGYTRYVAQGGDLGAYVCDEMGRQAPAGLLGIHLNLLKTTLVGPPPAEPSEAERAALAAIATMQTSGYGYSSSRPPGRRRSATP